MIRADDNVVSPSHTYLIVAELGLIVGKLHEFADRSCKLFPLLVRIFES